MGCFACGTGFAPLLSARKSQLPPLRKKVSASIEHLCSALAIGDHARAGFAGAVLLLFSFAGFFAKDAF